jgi:hypothetical protein
VGDPDADQPVKGRRSAAALLAVTVLVAAAVAALLPATGQAMVVTIGTPTAGFGSSASSYSCGPSCTVFQRTSANPVMTVPADGTITSWRVAGAGSFALTVLRPTGSGLAVVATSGTQGVGGTTPATISASLPVKSGDQIGVDLFGGNPSSRIYFKSDAQASAAVDSPAVATGGPLIGQNTASGDLDLNADVTLAPAATALDVTSGPTTGGTAVTISGAYLDGATTVLFGGVPAPFSAGAGGTLLVHTPVAPAAGAVDVVVRGPGGASTLAGAFTYTAPPGSVGVTVAPGAGGTPGGPVIRRFALSASSFLVAAAGSSAPSSKTGTVLRYTLSAAATVSFAIQRLVAGRIVPGRGGQGRYCQPALLPVPPGSRCTQSIALTPHLTQNGSLGANSLRFDGRLGGRALAPGSYRFTATAVDAHGRRAAAVTHAFRVLAPPARKCPQAHGSASSGGC